MLILRAATLIITLRMLFPTDRFTDFYVVSADLHRKLSSIAVASSLEFFTIELFEELQAEFLQSVVNLFNLRDPNKDRAWHFKQAQF